MQKLFNFIKIRALSFYTFKKNYFSISRKYVLKCFVFSFFNLSYKENLIAIEKL